MDKIKELGQVMTPINIVNHMIDDVLNLTEEQYSNYLFLDNSCGDGIFIKALLDRNVPKEHIYACDVDKEISENITSLIPVENFYLGSFFDKEEWINKFDVIIGNPPYVRIHNIQPEIKNQITNFNFCFGMYDLYYAFYEFSFKCLKENGTLVYISPNGFTKNASGKNLRNYIRDNNLLQYWEDFSNTQQFEGYSTYTCIIKLGHGNNISVPWDKPREKVGLSFSSLQNGLATLADRIFIADKFDNLEPECLRPIVKASTMEEKWCIFPPKTEEELQKYPKTYNYLLEHKDALKNRSITGNTKWFQFGRSQGIANVDNEKIVIATTMPNDGLKYKRYGKEWLVYSGLYATAKNLDLLEKELQSDDLLDYLIENGKPMRGGYTQITSTLLKNY